MTGRGTELVGENLRRLRAASGLSLAALADRSGVAKGTVSALERGQGNPTVETLFALAYALDATMADLVDAPGGPAPRVVRAVDRPFLPGGPLDARLLHRSQQQRTVLEVYELLVHPGAVQHAEAHRPATREHLYVIEGDLTGGPAAQPVELGVGDYATYAADVPHLYGSRGGARALLTMTINPQG